MKNLTHDIYCRSPKFESHEGEGARKQKYSNNPGVSSRILLTLSTEVIYKVGTRVETRDHFKRVSLEKKIHEQTIKIQSTIRGVQYIVEVKKRKAKNT